MTDQLTQQDVNNTAWAACDTFRGVIDPAQYKDYILVMLFLPAGIASIWPKLKALVPTRSATTDPAGATADAEVDTGAVAPA